MKHIIKISELLGTEIHTRFSLNPLKQTLNDDDEYLLDMKDVSMISRSAADELYTLSHTYKITFVHLSQFIQQMMDVVALGRFTPRDHGNLDATFIKCETVETLCTELSKLGNHYSPSEHLG